MRRRFITVALPVVAFGLTACGSTVSVQPHAGGTVSASARPAATTSATPSSSPTASSLTVGQTLTAKQVAKLTEAPVKAAGSAHMTMSVMGDMATAKGDLKFGADGTEAMSMDMSTMGMDMRMMYVDGVAYVKADIFGKKYVKIDPNGKDEFSKQFGSNLEGMSSLNGIGPLGDSVKWTVTKSGPDGATLSTKLTAGELKRLAAAEGKSTSATEMPPGELVLTSTLDADHRPVATTMTVGGKTFMSLTIGDWGKPVTITAPPASDVTTQLPKDLLGA